MNRESEANAAMFRAPFRTIAIGAAALAVTAALATPASAEPSPAGCPKGNFCLWLEGASTPVWSSPGNMNEAIGVWNPTRHIWAFDNANEDPGSDHVRDYWHYKYLGSWDNGSETLNVTCFHFNPGPCTYEGAIGGNHPHKVVHIHKAIWGPEC
ncbi:hypothetical protein ACIBG7_11520 [Nonomuraea sp. NPDC050328]|uniref:hypothetical protein n=1 Tax=Nonomuraea sp. NPDC050328 TaxID=3364361 RepID=UPI0037BAADC8